MRELINTTNFYKELVKSNKDLFQMLEELSLIGTDEEFTKLHNDINKKLTQDYETVTYPIGNNTTQVAYIMPDELDRRIRLAMTTINFISVGADFSRALFNSLIVSLAEKATKKFPSMN